MTLSNAQKVGVGALLGGVSTIGTSMLLRYYADNEGKAATEGGEIEYPLWWEHAPLVGVIAGAAMTALSYYLWGTEAAVACGITAVVAGVAAESDSWAVKARAKKDADELANPDTLNQGRPRGSNVADLKARVEALESEIDMIRRAA